jgi:hypothetical protein
MESYVGRRALENTRRDKLAAWQVQPVSLYAAGQERATTSAPAATRAAMPSALVPLLLRVCLIVGVVLVA